MTDHADLDQGYTRVANAILEKLSMTDISGREHMLVQAIIRKTYGYGKELDFIALEQLEEMTGIERKNISTLLKHLAQLKILIRTGSGLVKKIGINRNLNEWIKEKKLHKGRSKTSNLKPETSNSKPDETSNSSSQVLNSSNEVLDSKPKQQDKTSNLKPETLDLKPETSNLSNEVLNLRTTKERNYTKENKKENSFDHKKQILKNYRFDEFWDSLLSGEKTNKTGAIKKWETIVVKPLIKKPHDLEILINKILDDIEERKKFDRYWQRGSPDYNVVNPATYLNQRKFEDEWQGGSRDIRNQSHDKRNNPRRGVTAFERRQEISAAIDGAFADCCDRYENGEENGPSNLDAFPY